MHSQTTNYMLQQKIFVFKNVENGNGEEKKQVIIFSHSSYFFS